MTAKTKVDLKKREGKFRPSLLGRMDAIQALLEWGWGWRQIAAHFSEDVGLGGASEEHFRTEWSHLRKHVGMEPDRAEVARLKRAMLENTIAPDAWVQRARVKTHRPMPAVPATVERRQPVHAEPGVVERHRMASSAAGVSSSFAVPARQEASPSVGEPIVYSEELLARLEEKIKLIGTITMAEFMSELGFPLPVAEAAEIEMRKAKMARPDTMQLLFRRLVFHSMLRGKPDARAFVERLPGVAEWVALKREGVLTYEDAARRLA